jgi:hypothetical protein
MTSASEQLHFKIRKIFVTWLTIRNDQKMRKENFKNSTQYVFLYFIALAINLLIFHDNWTKVAQGSLYDPDGYMRLVRMQEALDRGDWFGDVASGGDSGLGLTLVWSHLLDGVILLLRAPLRLILPPDQALLWAGAITGPISVGFLGLLCAWAIAPLAQRRWLWTAPVAVALAPPIMGYGQLGGVTHHVALAVFAVGACGAGGRAAFGSIRSGILLGLFAGFGIWLSPEALPFGMMAFGTLFLSWVVCPEPGVAAALGAAGSAFLASITLGLAIDPPHAGYAAAELDRISVTFLCLAVLVCALCWIPQGVAARRLSLSMRLAAIGGAGIAAAALWLALFPGYLHGLAGLGTPEQTEALILNNAEWQPLDTASLFIAVAGPGALAVGGAFALALRRGCTLSGVLWGFAGICGAACVVLAFLHLRFAPYQAAGAAMMLPMLLSQVGDPTLLRWRSLARPGLLAAFLLVPMLAGMLYNPPSGTPPDGLAECAMPDAAQLLAPYGGTVVLAEMNLGPELLYRTRIDIVGALYIRGMAGAMRLRAAWRARNLNEIPPEMQATGARYVLACPGTKRSPFVDGPETTLFDRLNRDDPPGWLLPIAGKTKSGWRLYEVAPER